MTRLLLIRHGQTDYNLNRRYCGSSDPPLNVSGLSQAKSLAGQLKGFDIRAVYSSDLLRAAQTAGVLFCGHQIKTMPNFREFDFGIFEGLNHLEIMEKYPGPYQDWLADPLHISIPGGEKFADFKKRVDSALSLVISSNRNKTIALVTHSGPIRIILCRALGCGFQRFWAFNYDNAAYSIIAYAKGSAPKVISINSKGHR